MIIASLISYFLYDNLCNHVYQVFQRGSAASPQERKSSPKRKLSDMLVQEIEPLSPLQVNFPDENFSSSSNYRTAETPSTHTQATATTNAVTHGEPSPTIELRDKSQKAPAKSGEKKSQGEYEEQERGSWVNIKLVKDGRVSLDSSTIMEEDEEGGGGSGGMSKEGKHFTASLDRVS